MIKSIKLIEENEPRECVFLKPHGYKIEIDSTFLNDKPKTIQIEFTSDIVGFRNHDYKWVDLNQRRIANWYAPKMIKLETNQIVQANQNNGIWEVNTKNKKVLLWHFNLQNSSPIAEYDSNNSTHIIQAVCNKKFENPLALLFPTNHGIEFSRSKIPFSAIACFTDHCDFDTLSNLKQQREFFKTYNVKTTKGFFLNHFSKREDTASWEFHNNELNKWINDGHELAYHSLSQSIKSYDESIEDFLSFEPPFKNITTWIDHGFQPYNFTLVNCNNQIKKNFGVILKTKNISQLWNYIDTGTAVNGVINQLNPKQFTLNTYYNGVKHLGFKKALGLTVKNIIFHYSNSTKALILYKQVAKYLKTINRKKDIKKHFDFVINLFKLTIFLLPILVFWKTRRNKIYPLAEFAPLMFDHNLNGETFTVFQTLEMIDFKNALNAANLDLLVEESGVFIAHTYFSAPMDYHQGKLFNKENEVDPIVEERFKYLSERIQSGEIWNPALNELVLHIKKLEHILFDCNEKGELVILNDFELPYRKVEW